MTILYALSQIGLVLYMFLIGLQLNTGLLTKHSKGAAAISLSGILTPVAMGGLMGYLLADRRDLFSAGLVPWLTDDMQPTVLLGESFVAVAANPTLARAAIASAAQPAARWQPTGELRKSIECLPANVVFLSVGNPRASMP